MTSASTGDFRLNTFVDHTRYQLEEEPATQPPAQKTNGSSRRIHLPLKADPGIKDVELRSFVHNRQNGPILQPTPKTEPSYRHIHLASSLESVSGHEDIQSQTFVDHPQFEADELEPELNQPHEAQPPTRRIHSAPIENASVLHPVSVPPRAISAPTWYDSSYCQFEFDEGTFQLQEEPSNQVASRPDTPVDQVTGAVSVSLLKATTSSKTKAAASSAIPIGPQEPQKKPVNK